MGMTPLVASVESDMPTKKTSADRLKPLSFAPLTVDEALAALLKTAPPPSKGKPKARRKRRKPKKRSGK